MTPPDLPHSTAERTGRLRRVSDEAGFTLVEVLVTALIVALLSGATAKALTSTSHTSGDQRYRAQADQVASQEIDRLRGLSDQQLSAMASASSATSRTQTLDGFPYQVSTTAKFQDSSGNSSCTSSGVDYFKVTTTIGWSEAFDGPSNTPSVSAESVISRPVTGVLQTSVTDETGAPLAGAAIASSPVTNGVQGQSGQTDDKGCSVFAGLSAGNYNVTATKSGYVDGKNNATPVNAEPITAGGSAVSNSFQLGLAGSLKGTFAASTTSAAPTYGGQADYLSYGGNGATTTFQSASTNTTGSPMLTAQTSTSLFPWDVNPSTSAVSYANNYTVWGGKCSFQKPPTSTTGAYGLATVAPGQTATATVQEPFLNVSNVQATADGKNYNPVVPRDLVLSYAQGSCTDAYAVKIANPAATYGSYSGATIGTPPATGWLTYEGQPYAPTGALTVCADISYGGSLYSGTVTTSNTNMSGQNAVPTITINGSAGGCPGAA